MLLVATFYVYFLRDKNNWSFKTLLLKLSWCFAHSDLEGHLIVITNQTVNVQNISCSLEHTHTGLHVKSHDAYGERVGEEDTKRWRWGRRTRGGQVTKRRERRRDRNVVSISFRHLLVLFSLRKTLSSAAVNQRDKAFILLLINSIHLANQVDVLSPELLTRSRMLSVWSVCLLVQMCEQWICSVRCWLCFSFVKNTAASRCVRLPFVATNVFHWTLPIKLKRSS